MLSLLRKLQEFIIGVDPVAVERRRAEKAERRADEADAALDAALDAAGSPPSSDFCKPLEKIPSCLSDVIDLYNNLKVNMSPNFYKALYNVCDNDGKELLANHFVTSNETYDGEALFSRAVFRSPPENINSTSEVSVVARFLDSLFSNNIDLLCQSIFNVHCIRNQCGNVGFNSIPCKSSQTQCIQERIPLDWMLRHDYTQVVLMFGAETSGLGNHDEARKQILDPNRFQMSIFNYGESPFLPVYTAVGSRFQFYLYMSNHDSQPELMPLWDELDLMLLKDRIKLVLYTIIVFHVIRTFLVEYFPTTSLRAMEEKFITLKGKFVMKTLQDQTKKTRKELAKLYKEREKFKCDFLVHGKIESWNAIDRTITLELSPMGYRRRPRNKKEMRTLITCVAQALICLHKELKYLHRDIRLDNVSKLSKGQGYMLIDLEGGCRMRDDDNTGEWASRWQQEFQPQPVEERWAVKHDLWQVLNLLLGDDVLERLELGDEERKGISEWKANMSDKTDACELLDE